MPTNAIATARIADFFASFTLLPPYNANVWSGRDQPHSALDLVRDELELTWRQSKTLGVADRTPTIDQHDQAMLAVQKLIDEFMNAVGITAERFSKRHHSQLRGSSAHRSGGARLVSLRRSTSNDAVSRFGARDRSRTGR
jgi:hypothetical protein